jgi:enoyl-CoA hydratase
MTDPRELDALVSYRVQDGVAVLRMDDGKANAISHEMAGAIEHRLDQALADAVGAVVILGRPGRFCAGFDLATMQAGVDDARELLRVGGDLALRLYTFSTPVVLGVTGHALAMGAILLMATDVRIGAAGSFKIGMNELLIGMPVPRFATELSDDRLSRRHVDAAVNLATIFDPDGAAEAGFLDRVVAPDDVEPIAIERATELAASLHRGPFVITRENRRGAAAARIRAGLESDVERFIVSDG